MKDKIKLIIAAAILAAFIFGIRYWFSRPYIIQSGAYALIAALALFYSYPVYRFIPRIMNDNARPIQRLLASLLLAALLGWASSWIIRWTAIEQFGNPWQSEAAIVGLESCKGRFCPCEQKWTLQMLNGEQHKLCTTRIHKNSIIRHGETVAVTLRQSLFDRSIE